MNAITMAPEAPPLRVDPDGSIRLGASQVLFEVVIGAYLRGDSPEEIAEDYPTATLGDVYGAIAYYHRHRTESLAYLAWSSAEGDRLAGEVRTQQGSPPALKERLSARKAGDFANRILHVSGLN